ncbi:MAG: hypothetical protein J9259_02110 [Thermoplasmata archaeon YP2-bin.285]|uniref:PAS domain-containing protein n=1 Tax=Candidatus Sysuiplasma superficiale TaxID=2823368 RepID=A0A8J8CDM0_9ARCH|nr:hypothetical protein [Candidatus Sysuiplasma superficiale]
MVYMQPGKMLGRLSIDALIQSMTEAVVITDRKLSVICFNTAACDILGPLSVGSELAVGSGWPDLKADAMMLVSTGKSFEFGFNSSAGACTATLMPVASADGNDFIYCTFRRVGNDDECIGSNASAVEAIPFPAFIIDSGCKVVYANQEARRTFEETGSVCSPGTSVIDMFDRSGGLAFLEMFRRCADGTGAQSGIFAFSGTKPDQHMQEFRVDISSYMSSGGKRYYLAVASRHWQIRRPAVIPAHFPDDGKKQMQKLMAELEEAADMDSYFSLLSERIARSFNTGTVLVFELADGHVSEIAEVSCPPDISRHLLAPGNDFSFEIALMERGEFTEVGPSSPFHAAMQNIYKGYHTLMSFPMMSGGRPIGGIFLLNSSSEKYAEGTVSAVSALAQTAASRLVLFRMMRNLRVEARLHSEALEMLRRLRLSSKASGLYQSLSTELRAFLRGTASFTFVRIGRKERFVLASSDPPVRTDRNIPRVLDGARLFSPAGGVQLLPGGEGLPVSLPGGRSPSDTVIIPFSSKYVSGFTAVLSERTVNPSAPELFVLGKLLHHINHIVGLVTAIDRYEANLFRSRLLNVAFETFATGLDGDRKLSEFVRYLSDALRPISVAVFSVAGGKALTEQSYLPRAKDLPFASSVMEKLQSAIVSSATQRKVSLHEIAGTPGTSSSALPQDVLLVPVGRCRQKEFVIALAPRPEEQFDDDGIEFASFVASIAATSDQRNLEMIKLSESESFYRSLFEIASGLLSHCSDGTGFGAFRQLLSRHVGYDGIQLLEEREDGFARRIPADGDTANTSLIPVSELPDERTSCGEDPALVTGVRLPALFGQQSGSALISREEAGNGARLVCILWRRFPWTFTEQERRLFGSAFRTYAGASGR